MSGEINETQGILKKQKKYMLIREVCTKINEQKHTQRFHIYLRSLIEAG